MDLEARILELEKQNSELESKVKTKDENIDILNESINLGFFNSGQQKNNVTVNSIGKISGNIQGGLSLGNTETKVSNMNMQANINNNQNNFNNMNFFDNNTQSGDYKNNDTNMLSLIVRLF